MSCTWFLFFFSAFAKTFLLVDETKNKICVLKRQAGKGFYFDFLLDFKMETERFKPWFNSHSNTATIIIAATTTNITFSNKPTKIYKHLEHRKYAKIIFMAINQYRHRRRRRREEKALRKCFRNPTAIFSLNLVDHFSYILPKFCLFQANKHVGNFTNV